jgi:hypothetical protein
MAKPDIAKTADGKIIRPAFGRRALDDVPEQPLDIPPPPSAHRRYVEPVRPPVDLTGRPIVMLVLGDGNSGKTHYLRWLLWRMREAGRDAGIAAVDPGARTLSAWFPDAVVEPPGRDTTTVMSWLGSVFDSLMSDPAPAVIDFGGGGHGPLDAILSTGGNFVRGLEDAGVGLVVTYLLTPRVTELTLLAGLRAHGLKPAAQLLVLNEGRITEVGDTPPIAFAGMTRHSAFRAALDDGAFPVQMPAIGWGAATEMEAKRLHFGQARDGKVPAGATFPPLGGLKRLAVTDWLRRMEEAHAPVISWLP